MESSLKQRQIVLRLTIFRTDFNINFMFVKEIILL
jgi:hypothetical protein